MKQNNIPFTSGSLDLSFTTKDELYKKAFDLFGDKLTTDQILDKCSLIWGKYLKNEDNTKADRSES